MENHKCTQEEVIGKFKEFIDSHKWFKGTLASMAVAIFIQIGLSGISLTQGLVH